jgi:hypothetical protein
MVARDLNILADLPCKIQDVHVMGLSYLEVSGAEEFTSYNPKMDVFVLNSPRLTYCAACKALYECV